MPIVSEPMYFEHMALLVKIEGAGYGVDPVPTAAANGILVKNVTLAPMEGQDVKRDIAHPFHAASPSVPVGLHSVLSFDMEIVGSGTLGVAPAIGPVLRACKIAETVTALTKVEYTPVTASPESVHVYFYIDSVRYVLKGARGDIDFTWTANDFGKARVTLTGLFTVPTEVPLVSPILTGFPSPDVVTPVNVPLFTINLLELVLRELTLKRGNKVEMRSLANYEAVHIVDAEESLMVTVEAPSLATLNPYAISQAQTLHPIHLTHGTVAGRRVKLDVPSAQLGRLSGLQSAQGLVEYPLNYVPLPVLATGNDQWKITFD